MIIENILNLYKFNGIEVLVFILIYFIFLLLILITYLVGKDPKVDYETISENQIPSGFNPVEIELIDKKIITNKSIYGSILYLEYLGYFDIKIDSKYKVIEYIQKKSSEDISDSVLKEIYLFIFDNGRDSIFEITKKYYTGILCCVTRLIISVSKQKNIFERYYLLSNYYLFHIIFFLYFAFIVTIYNSIEYFFSGNLIIDLEFLFYWFVFILLLLIPVLINLLTKRTPEGVKIKNQINFYKKTIKKITKSGFGNLSFANNSVEYFKKTLPFMVAIGMERDFIKVMTLQLNMSKNQVAELKLKLKFIKKIKNTYETSNLNRLRQPVYFGVRVVKNYLEIPDKKREYNNKNFDF